MLKRLWCALRMHPWKEFIFDQDRGRWYISCECEKYTDGGRFPARRNYVPKGVIEKLEAFDGWPEGKEPIC